MSSLAIDTDLDTATAVEIQGDEISLSMMNGRRIIAPIWLFPELGGDE